MQQPEEEEGYTSVKGNTQKLIFPPTTTYLPFSESTSPFLGSKIKPQLLNSECLKKQGGRISVWAILQKPHVNTG